MSRALLVGVAVSLAVAAQASAVTRSAPVAVQVVDAEHEKLAADLVRSLNSEAMTRVQLAKLLNDTLPKTLAANPDFAAGERQYPGITKAFIAAMRDVIVEGTISRLPSLWTRLQPLYSRSFTTAELRTLIDFYTSPAGLRVIKAMGEGADYSQMMGNMIGGHAKVTTGDLKAGAQTGVAQVIRSATPEDLEAMLALSTTSAGKKLTAVNGEAQAEAAAWGNEPDPELDAQIDKAIQDVLSKYTGKSAQ